MVVQMGHSRLSGFISSRGTRRKVARRWKISASVGGIVVRIDNVSAQNMLIDSALVF
jgi:hypothetical protein